jgi:hypothetical protein
MYQGLFLKKRTWFKRGALDICKGNIVLTICAPAECPVWSPHSAPLFSHRVVCVSSREIIENRISCLAAIEIKPGLIFRACFGSRDSSVGIAMVYGLGGLGSILGRNYRFFCTAQPPDLLWGPPNLFYNGYRVLFPRGKVAEVKNGRVIPPLPRASSWCSA